MKNTKEFGDRLNLPRFTEAYRNWNVAKIGTLQKLKMFSLQIEERYGEVNWDPAVRTTYCYQCVEVSVESTGL